MDWIVAEESRGAVGATTARNWNWVALHAGFARGAAAAAAGLSLWGRQLPEADDEGGAERRLCLFVCLFVCRP